MDYQVIDNFLNYQDFKKLQDLIVFSDKIPLYLRSIVSAHDENDSMFDQDLENQNWNWYGNYVVYNHIPYSEYYDLISGLFSSRLKEIEKVKTFIRIKINFYPNTTELKEHAKHADLDFPHKGGLYSLNTCDGFTRMSNGDIVESVANRMVLFDASQLHNSSTTTNAKGRFNINFNWL